MNFKPAHAKFVPMPSQFWGPAPGRIFLGAVTVAILLAASSAAFRPIPSQAFTIIGCGTSSKVTVSPTSGQKSAGFTADGLCSPAPCGQALTFNFYWDSTSTQFWSITNSTCNAAGTYDTGPSPGFVPPAADNGVGTHKVLLNILNSAGAIVTNGSLSTSYSINSPPPPPPSPTRSQAQSSPTQTRQTPTSTSTSDCNATPTLAGCPSPSTKACPAAALPPTGTGGWGDNTIAALMVGSVIPIAGLAIFG